MSGVISVRRHCRWPVVAVRGYRALGACPVVDVADGTSVTSRSCEPRRAGVCRGVHCERDDRDDTDEVRVFEKFFKALHEVVLNTLAAGRIVRWWDFACLLFFFSAK